MNRILALSLLISGPLIANMAPEGFERFPNYYFVETGTYNGQGLRFALRAHKNDPSTFIEMHSIEINRDFIRYSSQLFTSYPNVTIWEGDSSKALWDVIKDMDKPITFWLDAHNGFPDPNSKEKNTPLLEELDQIKRHPIKTHTIVIDDMHCCNTLLFDYLSREDIIKKIKEINPNYTVYYVDGGDRGEYVDNVMVARVLKED